MTDITAEARSVPGGRLRTLVRGREDDPAWVRPTLLGLLAGTALLYLVGLSANGWANSYYSAAVQAATQSWKAFFFGSFDSSNFITVDKPPASLWVMDASARIFGVSSWSILVPQALEGVAAVGLLYATVRRQFTAAAGLIAGLVMALTPVAALMFRFNNPDALLTLLLVASAYSVTRALQRGSTWWLVAAGSFVGFAFLTKMLQALIVVPGFALVYLVAAPTPLRRRLLQLLAAGAAIVVSAGWWVAIVALWPAASRPYIGSSQDNSILSLIFGYNGFGRLTGNESGSVIGGQTFGTGGNPAPRGGMWGPTGITRLFNDEMGTQVSWLIPAALDRARRPALGDAPRPADGRRPRRRAAVGLVARRYRRRLQLRRRDHPPVLQRRAGACDRRARRDRRCAALAGPRKHRQPAAAGRRRRPERGLGVRAARPDAGLAALAALCSARRGIGFGAGDPGAAPGRLAAPARSRRRDRRPRGAARSPARLLGPDRLDASFRRHSERRTGRPLRRLRRRAADLPPGLRQRRLPRRTAVRHRTLGQRRARTSGRHVRTGPGGLGLGQRGGGFGPGGGFGRPGGSGGLGGLLDASTPSKQLVALLEHAGSYRWAAAAVGANSAAGVQIASSKPILAIGGFNGSDPTPTLAQFKKLVAAGQIHYFLANGGGGFGRRSGSKIQMWVAAHFSSRTVGGVTVYDLTARTA